MSTKSTIFLTNDNEHCYDDCSQPHKDKDGNWNNTITVEFDKKNIRVIANDQSDLIIEIDPGSELYEIFNSIRFNKDLARFR